MIEIIPATGSRLTGEFVELPYRLYAGSPHWVPPLRRDEKRRLVPRHNPFFAHGEMTLWLAKSDGRFVGRIAAIDDRLHNEKYRERLAWFGFFEAADAEVARRLLAEVETWGRARSARAVRGPANPSLNDSAGLLVDAFDDDPYVLMPYNPPAYGGYVESAGYRKAKDLLAWDIDLTIPCPERISKLAARVAQHYGVTVRTVDLKAFDRDLDILKSIYRAAWEDNWGFVPPSDDEIRQLAVDLKPVLDPEMVLFAERQGRPVACVVAIPDVNQVLKRMNGGLLPFGLIHFLRRRSIVTRSRLLLLGVVPEARRLGLYPLLISEIHRRAVARGYTRGELSWTLEDNHLIHAGIEAAGGRRYKTYRLYEKPLG
jgi:GNAT superfamily N-acetyltransferase